MPTPALALVLAAAVLHASWNALTKRATNRLLFLWSSMGVAAVGLLPVALAFEPAHALQGDGARLVAASAVLHAVYFFLLSSSYQHGDFSLVYPIARGLGVAIVPLLAFLAFDERLSMLGVTGIGLVVVGIIATAVAARPALGGGRVWGAGTGWAVLTGLSIAAYSIVDRAGARAAHPVPYLCFISLGAVLLLTPYVLRRRDALRAEWRVNWRTILVASTMNLSGYVLVLFAYRLAKTGYVVACRELSIVLSAFIGGVLLREGRLPSRLAGAAVILGGVLCVALAR